MPNKYDNVIRANTIIAEDPDPFRFSYSKGRCSIEDDKVLISGHELCPSNEDDAEVLATIAANPKFAVAKSVIESGLREYDQTNSCVSAFLADVQAGGDPVTAHDPYTGWELFMDSHSYSFYGAVRIVNACLKALADEYRLAKAAPTEPMTDELALREIEAAKCTLEKHYDSGFLLGFWHEQYDGFQYRYADGLYAERAQHELAEV
jgi:hypothetical protein